ncbi:MAG: ferrous iron transport protein B [Desulfovibrionaceae bacterium]
MTAIRMALVGNPNSGKTTLFNTLTGARRHVGNYPGITVEKHELSLQVKGLDLSLLDLPGTYSLSAYSQEEAVVRQVLTPQAGDSRQGGGMPQVLIDVINAGTLERNLYLAVQLLEMEIPLVLALNMMDEAEAKGLRIDCERLSSLLGIPVLPTVGRTGQGVKAVLERAVDVVQQQEIQPPLRLSYGADVDAALEAMTRSIEQAQFLTAYYPPRWVALKYLEGDAELQAMGTKGNAPLAKVLEQHVKRLRRHLLDTLDSTPEAIIADYRRGFITALLRNGVLTREEDQHARSNLSATLDAVLINRVLGPLIMLGVLWMTYQLTLSVGDIPKGWLEQFFGWLGDQASGVLPEGLLRSLLVSGVIAGVGSVLSFVPLIFILFMVIAVLDDTGYMARIAHMLDRVFRAFGLHGCSVMPYIVSGGIPGGCAIPGIMASRTLRSPRERMATMLTVSFLSCGAKIPVFLLFVSIFFPAEQQSMVLFGLTLMGWAVALLAALVLRHSLLQGDATPFVLELPPYRLPTLRGVCIHAWERTWMYLRKAGTVILAISILLWAGMTFPNLPDSEIAHFDAARAAAQEAGQHTGQTAEELKTVLADIDDAQAESALRHSVAGRLGVALEPVGKPAGFDWRVNIAVLAGIAAKEVVISTLGTAYSMGTVDPESADQTLGQRLAADPDWNAARALSLMLFVLLYSPCFISVVVLRQESGSWAWALLPVVGNTVIAYGVAVAAYHIMLTVA